MINVPIGTSLPPTRFTVTAEQIASFAAALGAPEHAELPTLSTCFGIWANPAWIAVLGAAGVPLERLLHGEEEYTYHAPIRPGTSVLAEATVSEVREKSGQSGAITLITLALRFSADPGTLLVEGHTVIVMSDEKSR